MRFRVGRLLSFAVAVLAPVVVLLGVAAGPAVASQCPNEQLRQESNLNPTTGVRYSAELPDCRAYEMVTPVEKGQANIGPGYPGMDPHQQASSTGEGFLYSSTGPLVGNKAGGLFSQYVASRGANGWSTVPIDAAQLLIEGEGSMVDEFLEFSPTLSCGFDETREALTPLPAGEKVGEVQNLYLWDAASNSRRLVTITNPQNRINLDFIHSTYYLFEGVNSDCSRAVFATRYQLLPGAPAEQLSLYEWDEGTLRLVSKLPDGAIVPLTRANGGNNTAASGAVVGAFDEGGSHVAFSALSDTQSGSPGEIDAGNEEVFVREEGASTVEASKSQTSTVDTGAKYQLGFGDGSPEGFQVLFIANHGLTATSSKGSSGACSVFNEAGCDLYDYNVAAKTLTDLSVDTNASDTEGASVFGVFGAGTGPEGSYVYFSAGGQLVPGKGNTEAVNNSAKEANIYVAHAGHIEYIAKIPRGEVFNGNGSGQISDFVANQAYPENYSVRVSGSGDILTFGDESSELAAVVDNGYNNNDSVTGVAEREFYLYSARTNSTVCVSCDPTGAPPVGSVETVGYGDNNGYAARALSENGERMFFTSADQLTPQAVALDVKYSAYEWEREGSDESCPPQEHPASSGGCIFLLGANSRFLGTTPNGDDAFLETGVPLVGQDLDGANDMYDLRVDGGFPAPAVAACTGEECQGALNEALSFPSAGSTGPPAVGNALPQPEPKPATETPKPKPKPLTRAQKLTNALKVCKKEPKRKRAACESRARKKYGAKTKAGKKRAKTKGSSSKEGK